MERCLYIYSGAGEGKNTQIWTELPRHIRYHFMRVRLLLVATTDTVSLQFEVGLETNQGWACKWGAEAARSWFLVLMTKEEKKSCAWISNFPHIYYPYSIYIFIFSNFYLDCILLMNISCESETSYYLPYRKVELLNISKVSSSSKYLWSGICIYLSVCLSIGLSFIYL